MCGVFFSFEEICQTEDCRSGDCELTRLPNGSIEKKCHCPKVSLKVSFLIPMKQSFKRVSVVKHVNVCVIPLPNVIQIHVGLVRRASMFPILIMPVYVHRIIRVKIVEF